jgi:hypothetical protein
MNEIGLLAPITPTLYQPMTNSMRQFSAASPMRSIDSASTSNIDLRKKQFHELAQNKAKFHRSLMARDHEEKYNQWPTKADSTRSKRDTSDSKAQSDSNNEGITKCRDAKKVIKDAESANDWQFGWSKVYDSAKKFYK